MKKTILTLVLFLLIACNEEGVKESTAKQLNISILTDLSDRIDPVENPMQIQKDMAIINDVIELFKEELAQKGTFKAKGKINFYFHPQMQDKEMLSLSEKLRIDFSEMDVKGKKAAFNLFEKDVKNSFEKIYSLASAQKKYPGSDIYRFFKDEVEDKCLISDTCFRNILVVITDGYMYWEKSLEKKGNRYSYLIQKSEILNKFRRNQNWEDVFEKEDYGFINTGKDLSDLEVILLEVNPSYDYPVDYDIIKKFWTKWLSEMNIKTENIKIVKTDLPANTKLVVKKFIKRSR